MKYRYEFKNKALGEAVYTIFGEEFARDEIEQQMPDFDDFIRIEVDEWDANNKLFNSHVEFSKTEIEKTLIYLCRYDRRLAIHQKWEQFITLGCEI